MIGSQTDVVLLCPGQGAQQVGMGKKWCQASEAARSVMARADGALSGMLPGALSALCFDGPADVLNRTDISQPALFACAVASHAGLVEQGAAWNIRAAAGLSLGEYTALHIAGVFSFEDGIRLVAERGRLMQEAAERSRGGMVALIGAEEIQAQEVCERARKGGVLVPANLNAPGQIVLSGDADACARAGEIAGQMGLRATPLVVAGAFHSPLMQPAAEGLAKYLDGMAFASSRFEVWSNVTARPHMAENGVLGEAEELLKRRLVEQLTSPVRWSESCSGLVSKYAGSTMEYHELAPGGVLRGLMRRIDRNTKVTSHDEP
jgi:[acyl-carrier-protein] S-malonyltransferase